MNWTHFVNMGSFLPNPGSFNESAYRGRQMLGGIAKQKCALQNGFFEKSFKRIFEREALSDPLRLARQYRIQQAKKNLSKAFLPCNGVKKPWEHTDTYTDETRISIKIHQDIHIKIVNKM